MIIGFEDFNGKPVVKTEEEKKEFLKMCGYKEEDIIFADDMSSNVFVAMAMLQSKNDKKNDKLD